MIMSFSAVAYIHIHCTSTETYLINDLCYHELIDYYHSCVNIPIHYDFVYIVIISYPGSADYTSIKGTISAPMSTTK